MPAERREQVTHAGIESTANRKNSPYWRKAVAFTGWHEPCDWRWSSTDL